ncbi:MAG: MqnA/MqnD/SBP family protein [Phycisphaeraceae bacterium]
MTTQTQRKTLRIGHSPDPDDAFMWFPLANFPNGTGPGGKTYTPAIDTGPYHFVHVLEDIQSLNERSEKAELEITALSIHQYPFVAKHYALTSCGSSMGDNYGPILVATQPFNLSDIKGKRIAIPGRRTTAWLALQLLLHEHGLSANNITIENVMFDQIINRVGTGEFDAGLLIHEGQLTYADAGLHKIVDLGQWWTQSRKLPLPLGGNAIRRDLGDQMRPICSILLNAIRYALEHRDQAVEYALNYARDMGADLADRFVGMYVNQWSLDYGDRGRQAVTQLLTEAANANLTPDLGEIDFVEP